MDRLGLVITENDIYKETFSRHRPVMNIYDKVNGFVYSSSPTPLTLLFLPQVPMLAADTFVAPSASVIGRVQTLDRSSVWYGAVLRADQNKIKLGYCSSVQDR